MDAYWEAVPEESLSYARRGLKNLTEREGQVLRFVASGYSSKQVAAKLGLSPRTVEIYRNRILNKLGASSTVDLVRILASLSQLSAEGTVQTAPNFGS